MRSKLIILAVVAAVSFVLSVPSTGGEKSVAPSQRNHEIEGKILYLVTRPKDSKSDSGYGLIEKAKLIHLGERPFLVGQVPDMGEWPGYKLAAGKRVWTPVSEIVQITEFKTVAEVQQYFEAARKPLEKVEP